MLLTVVCFGVVLGVVITTCLAALAVVEVAFANCVKTQGQDKTVADVGDNHLIPSLASGTKSVSSTRRSNSASGSRRLSV